MGLGLTYGLQVFARDIRSGFDIHYRIIKRIATSYIEIVKDFYRMQIFIFEIISGRKSETFSDGSETTMRNDTIILVWYTLTILWISRFYQY